MQFRHLFNTLVLSLGVLSSATVLKPEQAPFLRHAHFGSNVSLALFAELEELARIVDISYCVGLTSLGISKPFQCLSRCTDFPRFELVTTWNTGPLLSDSCGYIALDHGKQRILVAFRGTYSVTNTVVDLSTVPQEYVPYPGDGDDSGKSEEHVGKAIMDGISGRVKREMNQAGQDKCSNCTVHMGFYSAWHVTRRHILSYLEEQVSLFPSYKLNLVGHSLGGAVAALAALDFEAHGWDPVVTTFGEPRVGNTGLVKYINEHFNLRSEAKSRAVENDMGDDMTLRYRRVTHIDDPVPLLPLTEWGYAMHAGEIYISKPALSPDTDDLQHCQGDNDQHCIAGQDSTTSRRSSSTVRKRDLLASVQDEIHDVVHEPWGIPSRYKLWQLFFAHRDYFWRLGLCVPGGDPLGGGKYEQPLPELR